MLSEVHFRVVTAKVAGVTFSDYDTAPVQKFWIRIRNVFKFENPTPATIDVAEMQQCLYFSNDTYTDRTDSRCSRKYKVTPDTGPVFHEFFTPAPGPKNAGSYKSRIRHSSESVTTSALQ